MTDQPCIAIDAMGGDEGLAVMLAGVARARRRSADDSGGLRFLLVGDEAPVGCEFVVGISPAAARDGRNWDSVCPAEAGAVEDDASVVVSTDAMNR